MEKGKYIYYGSASQEEIDLVESILNGVNLKEKEEIAKTNSKVLELPFNEQVHFVHGVIDTKFNLDEEGKTSEFDNISNFIGQDIFKIHRTVIYKIVDSYNSPDEKIYELSYMENLLGIKIVDLTHNQGVVGSIPTGSTKKKIKIWKK